MTALIFQLDNPPNHLHNDLGYQDTKETKTR
jgi:hypothetical protein